MHPPDHQQLKTQDCPIEQLLKISDVMASLGIGRSTFYNMVKAGHLPLVKVLGSSRVRASDLRLYIDRLPELHSPEADELATARGVKSGGQ